MNDYIVTAVHNGKTYRNSKPIQAQNTQQAEYLCKGLLSNKFNCKPDEIFVTKCDKKEKKYDIPEGFEQIFKGF